MEDEKLLDRVLAWARENPGRALGTLIGFLIGLSLISLGFWKTLVVGIAHG